MGQSFIRIMDIRDIPAPTIERAGKTDVLVQYAVDERRMYTTTIPKEDYSPEKALEQVKHEELERQKIIGQTLIV